MKHFQQAVDSREAVEPKDLSVWKEAFSQFVQIRHGRGEEFQKQYETDFN